jgi:hypothetical protein
VTLVARCASEVTDTPGRRRQAGDIGPGKTGRRKQKRFTHEHFDRSITDRVRIRRPVPRPLGDLLLALIADGKPYTGIGSPAGSQWLFPGLLPGQPITAKRLAERLRGLGIPVQAGRRAALIDLAGHMPAAVLAGLLGLHPTTAVKWMHQAGADWTRYAAEVARTRNHQPGE